MAVCREEEDLKSRNYETLIPALPYVGAFKIQMHMQLNNRYLETSFASTDVFVITDYGPFEAFFSTKLSQIIFFF